MTSDHHERARLLIALAGAERSGAEQSWLAVHLASRTPCREFAETVG
jgi:hypothetical protein